MTTAELTEKAQAANGRRKTRTIKPSDIARFEELFAARKDDPKAHTIRVYAADGFVANSYQYRAEISYIEARRAAETNEWNIVVSTCDAKRSRGQGVLETVNGREA